MKPYLLPIFVLLIVGCGNRNPANIVVENRIRQTEQTDSIIGDSYERDTIQGDFNGDGKIEYAYSESNPAEYYSLDEVDDGKLNNITFSNPTIPAIETELKKREGDNDSFAQLKYIQMMAYMMLGQWNEANRISQLMNQMPPQDAAVGRARALLAQAVLCIHTKQEAKPYFDRFMTEAEDARRSSLFMYHELMADYYFVCLYYAMQNKQYKQASEITAKLADVMNNLTEESPIRGVYMQIQFLNKCGDLAYFTHHYQKALDIYESTISLFYEYHANSKVQCYTYMYDWVSTLLLDNDFYKAEQTMRQMGTARQGIIQQAFILALHVLHTDVQAGKELVAHLKTRKLYKSEEFYAPVLLLYSKQMKDRIGQDYQPTLNLLIQLLS